MFKRILVPTDGSILSHKAIDAAVNFARSNGSKIIGLSVAEPYPFMPLYQTGAAEGASIYEEKMHEVAQQHVQKVADMANASNVQHEILVTQSPNPYVAIIDTAKQHHCDVIFMASHGRHGLNKLFIGSETQKVLSHTDLPVMVFR
jgi:nucleotide-binding universal stress UspA family protein